VPRDDLTFMAFLGAAQWAGKGWRSLRLNLSQNRLTSKSVQALFLPGCALHNAQPPAHLQRHAPQLRLLEVKMSYNDILDVVGFPPLSGHLQRRRTPAPGAGPPGGNPAIGHRRMLVGRLCPGVRRRRTPADRRGGASHTAVGRGGADPRARTRHPHGLLGAGPVPPAQRVPPRQSVRPFVRSIWTPSPWVRPSSRCPWIGRVARWWVARTGWGGPCGALPGFAASG
jgi:hypothetical protein